MTPPALPPRLVLILTLVAYAVVQILYVTATPIQAITLPDNLPQALAARPLLVGIGPDEKEHFLYVLSIAERGKLPDPDPARRGSADSFVSYQAQHPPLFYALAALVYRLTAGAFGERGIWLLLRGLCAVCGGIVVVLAARAAAVAFPDRPAIALAAAPMIAFLPMFGHLTGNLSNEPLAMVFGAWAWLQIVRIVRAPEPPTVRAAALLGATLGLAALTRLTALLWLPAALIGIAYAARTRRPLVLATLLGVFALLVAPWFIRNQIVFGTPFLRTFDRPMLAFGTLDDFLGGAGIVPPNAPMRLTLATTLLWFASTSWFPFWLVQFFLPAPPLWQLVAVVVDVAVLMRLFLHASRVRRGLTKEDADPAGRVLLWAAGASVVFCVLALVQQQFFSDWNVVNSAGRYTAAAAPASALVFLFAIVGAPRGRSAERAAVAVAVVMLAFDLYTVSLVRRFYAANPAQDSVQKITIWKRERPLSG